MSSVYFVVVIAALFSSCCSNLDCISDNYSGQFRIVSAADTTDLLFGSTKKYNKDQIKFYSVTGTDSIFFDRMVANYDFDSVLLVNFSPRTDRVFMRLSDGDIDTIDLTYETFSSRCCGEITDIKNFRFNNAFDIPGGYDIQLIRK